MEKGVLTHSELKDFLDVKYEQFNSEEFIISDPVQIPHEFSKIEDIEISGFLAASIAWGNRKMIIRNARRIIEMMDGAPYDFIVNANDSDFDSFKDIKHRTFNGEDCIFFLKSLANIYKNHDGLKSIFEQEYLKRNSVVDSISNFRKVFFEIDHPKRTEKHISNIDKKSTAKRINMFLRWMVRKDDKGVDFGLWSRIKPADLFLPLDVHSGNVARKLGLLSRTQKDWQAVEEVTNNLRKLDATDPVKYDFALFGLGVFEKFAS